MKTNIISIILFITFGVLDATGQCWEKISVAVSHSLAIRKDGSLWAWGSSGDLGIGISSQSVFNRPIQVGLDYDWSEISASGNFSLSIKNDGSLWVWGSYPNAILGGNDTNVLFAFVPVQLGNDYDWSKISAGGQHALAIKTDGTLWGWGMSNLGQVGNGLSSCFFCPPIFQQTPVQIGSDNDWKQVNASNYISLAIKNDGTLWGWGDNTTGIIDNSFLNYNLPTQIGTDKWSQIESGEYVHALGLKADGTIWNWGYNICTDTPFVVLLNPTQIGTDNDWNKISAGADHDNAIKRDGSLWSWGRNYVGQMANGNTNLIQSLPEKIDTTMNNNFVEVSGGNQYSMAIKTDGSLWGWGSNGSGNLGDGTTVNKTLPVLISCSTVGIKDKNSGSLLSIYPNPSENFIRITSKENLIGLDLTIYDINGRSVVKEKITTPTPTINTSNLSAGIYLLRIDRIDMQNIKLIKK